MWARIRGCTIKDVFLSTGLRSGLDEEDMEDLGLMTGHAYSVLQCYEVPRRRLSPRSYPAHPARPPVHIAQFFWPPPQYCAPATSPEL